MSSGSLRLRLFATAAVLIAFALFITGLAIVQLFERQIRERVLTEIENNMLQLAGSIVAAADGTVKVSKSLADPRFREPYGGRYWRIDFAAPGERATIEPLRSRSMWDSDIEPSSPIGPQGETLIANTRQISIESGGKPIVMWLTIFVQSDEVMRPIGQLRDQLILSFVLIGVLLALGAWLQVTVGLKPLETLRRQLADVRSGLADRLSGSYPSEVAPLVGELNDVLDMREKSLERARRRAGDLAHGLKTPLTILSAIARDLRKRKLQGQANEIDEQTEAMRRHVEQALVRARLSTGRGHVATPLLPLAEKVIAALQRLPKGDEIDWEVNVPKTAAVAMETGDLTELLGNLLDNARKWAKSRIKLSYRSGLIIIEDDGPGVPEADLGRIRERGQRLDETLQGSGLGLSIVEDIADIYNLSVDYDRSALGGLRVTVRV